MEESKGTNMTLETNQEALCFLHGIQDTLMVEVLGGNPQTEAEQVLKTQRIKLKRDFDFQTLKTAYPKLAQSRKELLVPESCIILPVSSNVLKEKLKPTKKLIFSEYYEVINVKNVRKTDLVAWTPLLRSSRTELIPCTIYFIGKNLGKPASEISAFVCPLKSIVETHLSTTVKTNKLNEYGKIFEVPLNQIYRWEDINIQRHLIHLHLSFDKVASREVTYESNTEIYYEFVYKQVDQSHNGSETTGIYPDLKELSQSEKEESGPRSTNSQSKRELEQETLDKQKTKAMDESFDNLNSNHTDNHEGGSGTENETKNLPARLEPVKCLPESDNDEMKEKNDDSAKKPKRQVSRRTPLRDKGLDKHESWKMQLFGTCFVEEGNYEKVTVAEIESGDMVVATPEFKDGILGKVDLICEIPTLKQKQIFMGVKFEENIDVNPFQVRHTFGNTCTIKRCQDGKHVYIPIEFLLNNEKSTEKHLRILKEKANSKKETKDTILASDIHVDFSYEANRRDFLGTPLEMNKLSSQKLAKMGIEGNQNSCYIDAVLFSLFGFTNRFDSGFNTMKNIRTKYGDENTLKIEAARNLLRYDIVTPLRYATKVSWKNVYKLRVALAQILDDKSYLGNFMDAETFIQSLFATVLQVPEFFEIGEDTKDFVLQLFPPMTPEEESVKNPSVQYLLREYCDWAEIKLREIPKTGFLIKLPVSEGIPQYKKVYPNLNLQLDGVLDGHDGDNNIMALRAVICLKTNHFTCFVRTFPTEGKSEEKPKWVFHDSMAIETGGALLTECVGLEEGLDLIAAKFYNPPKSVDMTQLPAETKRWLDIFLSTAYICIYEPPYDSTAM